MAYFTSKMPSHTESRTQQQELLFRRVIFIDSEGKILINNEILLQCNQELSDTIRFNIFKPARTPGVDN